MSKGKKNAFSLMFGRTTADHGVVVFGVQEVNSRVKDFLSQLDGVISVKLVITEKYGIGIFPVDANDSETLRDEAGEHFNVPVPKLPESISISRYLET